MEKSLSERIKDMADSLSNKANEIKNRIGSDE